MTPTCPCISQKIPCRLSTRVPSMVGVEEEILKIPYGCQETVHSFYMNDKFLLYWSGTCRNDTIAVYYMLFTLEWSPYREYLNDTVAVYYMLFTLEWSPYREYLNFFTKELSFDNKQIWHVHSFVYVRSVILTVYYVKSNHNTDVEFAKCSYYFFLSFWNTFFLWFWELRLGNILMLFLILTQISASTFL